MSIIGDRSEVQQEGEVSRCVEVKSDWVLRGSLLGVIAIRATALTRVKAVFNNVFCNIPNIPGEREHCQWEFWGRAPLKRGPGESCEHWGCVRRGTRQLHRRT